MTIEEVLCGNPQHGKTGRSERIRTSDPLLPKQVRYQAALRSDRGGRGSASGGGLQEGSPRKSDQSRGWLRPVTMR